MAALRQLCSVSRHLSCGSAVGRSLSTSSKRLNNEVGFVGLGNMGAHMARNLLKKGYSVTVFDVVAENVNSLVEAGAQKAGSPAEVAAEHTLVVTMLPSSPHVKQVYTGKNGILSTVQKGTLLLDSSTIDPFVSIEMEQAASAQDAIFMDAPVSGGVNAARDGVLTFMVGGREESFPQAESVLQHMGKNVVYTGKVGTGEAAKICNNMLLAINMIGTSETMNMGIKLGLDPKMLAKILNISSGRSWCTELYNPCPGIIEGVPSSNDYKGGFGTALMSKDLGLSQDAANMVETPTPLGSMAHEIYQAMCKSGFGQRDFSAAYLYVQELKRKKYQ